jgi:hypothetical protein
MRYTSLTLLDKIFQHESFDLSQYLAEMKFAWDNGTPEQRLSSLKFHFSEPSVPFAALAMFSLWALENKMQAVFFDLAIEKNKYALFTNSVVADLYLNLNESSRETLILKFSDQLPQPAFLSCLESPNERIATHCWNQRFWSPDVAHFSLFSAESICHAARVQLANTTSSRVAASVVNSLCHLKLIGPLAVSVEFLLGIPACLPSLLLKFPRLSLSSSQTICVLQHPAVDFRSLILSRQSDLNRFFSASILKNMSDVPDYSTFERLRTVFLSNGLSEVFDTYAKTVEHQVLLQNSIGSHRTSSMGLLVSHRRGAL